MGQWTRELKGALEMTGDNSAGGDVRIASLVHRGSKRSRLGNKEVRAGRESRTGGGDRVSESAAGFG